tara:strand:- start:321 stop:452 length:132 start_codon:yes stop_codon:yes gene_type:complete
LTYDHKEIYLFFDSEVMVNFNLGEPKKIGQGDLVLSPVEMHFI